MTSTVATAGTGFVFDNTYARQLEGLYVPWQAAQVPESRLVKLNHALAEELGLNAKALDTPAGAAIFSGNQLPPDVKTIAQAYAGHQFGGAMPGMLFRIERHGGPAFGLFAQPDPLSLNFREQLLKKLQRGVDLVDPFQQPSQLDPSGKLIVLGTGADLCRRHFPFQRGDFGVENAATLLLPGEGVLQCRQLFAGDDCPQLVPG